MKTIRSNKVLTAVLLAGTALFWSACTDTWNEHYDVTEGGMSDQPTLYENIKSDPNLANFYRVITSIGATDLLNSPQQLTVWAPKSLTSSQADSIIAVYQNGVNEDLKWEDNKAVAQFLYNHAALYARPISSLTNDTVKMLSKKYMQLIGKSRMSGTMNGRVFNEAVTCSNGILYKTEDVLNFFPNVRECLEQNGGLDSVSNMIKSYDEYTLDESSSVAGGVEDGKVVYIDSVTVFTNSLLDYYGYIYREDSLYSFIAPTDELWKKEYDKYSKYYNYNPLENKADSLMDANTKLSIVMGRFFNTGKGNKYNRHPEDSLVNTSYYERQAHNPRLNVYYNPHEGILNGLDKIECSNGNVYLDNIGVIDPRTTFFGRDDVPAYASFYYELPTTNNQETMNAYSGSYETFEDDSVTLKKTYYFLNVTSKSTSQTEITYTIPSTMSGAYYNIYLVTVPDFMTNLPCWFQVGYAEKNEKGAFPTSFKAFTNPHSDEVMADENVAEATFSNKDRCYIATAEKLDTILIQSAVQFTYSSASLSGSEIDGVVKLQVKSIGPSQGTWREKRYTRTLRLNEFILVPFETEAEAKAAADDTDAFNDEILEANKEN